MDKMNSDTLINNYLNDGKWEKGIELSQVHNQLEDSFLQHDLVNIKQECDSEYTEYGLPQEVKEELTQISPQFTCVIKKEEPDVGVHDSKLIEVKKEPCVKEDYTENNDVIIEKEIVYVTSGDATNENVQKLIGHCAQCEEDYDLYCIKCPMLSSILDNNTLDRSDERPKHSLPRHTLQIRNGHGASGVYAMKLIPKGTRFGPFDGLDALQMTGGFVWKLNSGKLAVDTEHMNQSNWMQYVNYTEKLSHQNVAIFQHNGSLFFRSNRNIIPGEQLLVSYEEEKVKNADDRIYCCPTSEETLPDVYACTVCCLGFSSEVYLREHKAICGYSENKEIQEIVQCAFCKIYLDFKDNCDHHMKSCCVKYTWKEYRDVDDHPFHCNICGVYFKKEHNLTRHMHNKHNPVDTTRFVCPHCPYTTNNPSCINRHLQTHADSDATPKPSLPQVRCEICGYEFKGTANLQCHMRNKHGPVDQKRFACPLCSFTTNYRTSFKRHQDSHGNSSCKQVPGPERCDICGGDFKVKRSLDRHMRDKHGSLEAKRFVCPHCPWRTCYSNTFKRHVQMHGLSGEEAQKLCEKFTFKRGKKTPNATDTIVYSYRQCDICGENFKDKATLDRHIRNEHGDIKRFSCPHCSFRTNYRTCIRRHLQLHEDSDVIRQPVSCQLCGKSIPRHCSVEGHMRRVHGALKKLFLCELCGKSFSQRGGLAVHIKGVHGNVTGDKNYKCSRCQYQTNTRSNYFSHVRNQHPQSAGTSDDKKYKCSVCSYATNYATTFKQHMRRHVEKLECQICGTRCKRKVLLNRHMRDEHGVVVVRRKRILPKLAVQRENFPSVEQTN